MKPDEIIAVILAVLGIFIVPLVTNDASNLLIPLGQIALVYLFICVAMRKYESVVRKYHTPVKPKDSSTQKE